METELIFLQEGDFAERWPVLAELLRRYGRSGIPRLDLLAFQGQLSMLQELRRTGYLDLSANIIIPRQTRRRSWRVQSAASASRRCISPARSRAIIGSARLASAGSNMTCRATRMSFPARCAADRLLCSPRTSRSCWRSTWKSCLWMAERIVAGMTIGPLLLGVAVSAGQLAVLARLTELEEVDHAHLSFGGQSLMQIALDRGHFAIAQWALSGPGPRDRLLSAGSESDVSLDRLLASASHGLTHAQSAQAISAGLHGTGLLPPSQRSPAFLHTMATDPLLRKVMASVLARGYWGEDVAGMLWGGRSMEDIATFLNQHDLLDPSVMVWEHTRPRSTTRVSWRGRGAARPGTCYAT